MVRTKWGQFFLVLSLVTSLLFCGLSLSVARIDLDFSRRWLSFSLWILSISIMPIYIVCQNIGKTNFKKVFKKEELLTLALIILLTLISRFIFLKTYPFVAVMDEIRDGGLNAYQVVIGVIRNIHGYGRYESHGLIIPILIIPFAQIFRNSVFAYRIPTALISFLDILTIYYLSRKIFNRRVAFFASLILINIPLHLYYSRTEVVVIFSSLLTSILLLLFYFLIKNKNLKYYVLMGLALGFFSGFHASVRTVVFATSLAIILTTIFFLFKEKNKLNISLRLLFLFIFFFVGFGPRLLFTSPNVFFHSRTISLINQETGTSRSFLSLLAENRQRLTQNYLNSFGAYISKPVYMHFQDRKPILSPLLSIFFILGIISSLFITKNWFAKYLVILALLLPFTNSAITECINCDHRLVPMLPISAVLSALGFEFLISTMTRFGLKKILFINLSFFVFAGYILSQGYLFFSTESASRGKGVSDYLSMHTIYLLQSLPTQSQICLFVSPKNYNFFNLLHIKEQYEFFLPNIRIEKTIKPELLENEIYITKDCNLSEKSFALYQLCLKKSKFICPLDYENTLNIYIDRHIKKDFILK